jgi:hypothetical protein
MTAKSRRRCRSQILQMLIRDKNIGRHIVPIVPDESHVRHGRHVPAARYLEPAGTAAVAPPRMPTSGLHKETRTNPGPAGRNQRGGRMRMDRRRDVLLRTGPDDPVLYFHSMFGSSASATSRRGGRRARGFLLGGRRPPTLNGEGCSTRTVIAHNLGHRAELHLL